MSLYSMKEDIREAENALRDADNIVKEIAPLLVGRLRHANGAQLAALKKELRDFDLRTWKWKDK